MDSIENIERRARWRYESARLRRALLGFAPALIVLVVAELFARRSPATTLSFGLGMFALGVGLLWYGRGLRRAVLPGLAAGLFPLTLVLCMNHVGHVCMDGRCYSVCVPSCTAGGIVAGLIVAGVGVRYGSGLGFGLAASAMALLTGAMGCTCVGYSGLAGLAIGFGIGTAAVIVKRAIARGPWGRFSR